jgi:hypothetical protein
LGIVLVAVIPAGCSIGRHALPPNTKSNEFPAAWPDSSVELHLKKK